MSSPENVFTFIGRAITSFSEPFVQETAPSVIAAIEPYAIAGVAIYFAVMGYMVLSGAVQEPFWTFLKTSAKIMIVATCALNSATYIQYVVNALQGLESNLLSALGQSQFAGGDDGLGAYHFLDQALNKSQLLIGKCFEHAGTQGRSFNLGTALGWVVTGLFVIIGSLVVTLLAAVNIITAKIALVTFFALGPLFIMSLMWPVTARFFDSWFASVLNYTFTSVLSAVILTMGLAAFERFIKDANFDDSSMNPIVAGVQVLALGLILGFLLRQVSSMASSLAGGMGLSSAGIGWMTAPFRMAARGLAQRSQRLDPGTGKMVERSALGHLIAGSTLGNPRYRQALMSGLVGDMKRNWGRPDGGTAKEAK